MLEQYEFEGTIFNVHPSQKEDFLKKYPNAQLKQDESGKTSDPVNVEANAGSNNMASNSADGLSAFLGIQAAANIPLPGASSLLGSETKAKVGTFAYAVKENPLAVFKGLLKGVKPGAAGAVDTGIEIVYDNLKDIEESFVIPFVGGKDYAEKQQVANKLVAAKDAFFEEGYGKFIKKFLPAPVQMLMTGRKEVETIRSPFKKIIEKERAKYGNTISEEILKGTDADYESIGSRILSDGLTSLPYTIASMHPVSATYLGAGIAGDKFIEETQKNPDKTLFQLAGNAALTGGIEMADAWLTRKMFRSAGLLQAGKEKVAGDVVKQMNKGISRKALDIIGIGVKEGATEIGQAIATRINDKVWFNPDDIIKNIDEKGVVSGLATTDFGILKNIYSIIDEGIIGGFSGGGISSVSTALQSNSVLKQRAEQLLTPNSINKRKSELYQEYVKRQNEITKAVEEGKPRRAAALLGINRKISKEIRALERTNRLVIDNIQGKDLQEYANNIDSINALSEGGEISPSVQKEIDALSNRNNEIFDTNLKNNYGDNVSFAEIASGQLGMETTVASSTTKFKELIKKETGKNIKDAEYTNGVFIGNGKVIINEEVALKLGAVGVGSHEILHPILNAMVGNIAAQQNIVEEFKNSLTSSQKKWTEGEMKRQGKIEGTKEYYSEYLTVFSEGLVKNRISFDLNFGEQIKDWITKLYKGKGYKNIDFKSGQGVYNFLKAYDKSRKEGGLSEEVLSVLDMEEVKKAKTLNNENQKSSISNEVQEIYNEKGIDGAFEILSKYEGMAKKQASRFRDVPGYATNSDLLVDEILTGKRGVFDLIRSYNPGSGVPLAAYINKFLKSRAIEAANRILDTKFKSDITEAKTVKAAPEVSEEAKISEERPSLRKTLGLSDQVVDKVKNAVIKTFGTRLPNVSTPQFVKELQKRYRTELKPTIAKMMGRQESYSDFLNENFRLIYEILPQSIINKRFSAFAEPVLDDTGKQRREKTAQGNAVFRKKKITRKEFVDYFIGEDVKPSTRGTRKTALAEALSEEIAFDATMSVIKTPEVFTKINAINGLIENYTSEVAKQIDRSIDFQFSRELQESILFEEVALVDGKLNIENYPIFKAAVEKEMANKKMIKSRGFGGSIFEYYYQAKINDLKIPNVKSEGEARMGNTGVDNITTHLNKSGEEIKVPKELKESASAQFGSGQIQINEKLEISTTKDGETLQEYLSHVYDQLPTYLQIHKRVEELQSEKIPFSFPQKGYTVKAFNQAKKEIGTKKLNINLKNLSSNGIVKHYNKKGVYNIYIGDKGEYVLGEDKYNTNFPYFNAKASLYISLRSSESTIIDGKKYGNYTLRGAHNIDPKSLQESVKIEDANYAKSYNQFSKEKVDLDQDINDMIENKTGIGSEKRYAAAKAAVAGKDKGRFDLLGIPPSAQDFMGLMYKIVGKGKKGDQHLAWFKTNLLDPFAKAMVAISNERVKIGEKFKEIKSIANIAPKDLNKKISGEPFTVEQAIRTYIWTQQGMEIPGLSKADKKELNKYVSEKENLLVFANQLMQLSPANVYPKPDNNWLAGTLTTDLLTSLNTTTRKEALSEWQGNVDVIFSEANMNKLEAAFGKSYRSALENMLQRMQTGRNRGFAGDSLTGRFVDWLNGSVGAIMFFNMRSAVLQTISAVNFVNWSDNNPLKAAAAFANQPQYWGDVVYLMNSDYLVERRNGLKINVNEADIAELAAESKNKAKAFVNKLLKLGFLPTQIADSFAIATGGATFYRNRIKSYVKDGMSQKEAEEKAFLDFREISEESQQSSRPDRISQQQAGPLGRLILAFANTPAQYARLIQKASSDLANGRGDAKTNISKIAYYGAIQNVIFNAMQQALFAMMYGDEPEDEKKSEKYGNIVNGMVDSLLRGAGFAGAAVSTIKNTLLKVAEGKPAQDSAIELINISPPISSKIRKVRSAGRTFDWNKKEIKEKGLSLDNPAAMAIGQLVSATTNVPLDRGIKKLINIKDALDSENEEWIRVATALGWSKWELEWKENKKKRKVKVKNKLSTRSSLGGPSKL